MKRGASMLSRKKDVLKKSADRWWTRKAGPGFLGSVLCFGIMFSFLASRYIVNCLYVFRPFFVYFFRNEMHKWKPVSEDKVWGLQSLQNYEAIKAFHNLYIGIILIGIALSILITYRWWRRFHVINHNEHGKAELATRDEVEKSAIKVPDRYEEFPGIGGIPIAHTTKNNRSGLVLRLSMTKNVPEWLLKACGKLDNEKQAAGFYYFNNETLNTMTVGISRSGKGEMVVNPAIDLLSRAKTKSSLLVHDPKGELLEMSYKTLRKRGYNVQVLNLKNMNKSMSYNPLSVAIKYAKRGNVEKTQQYINSVSTAIYKKNKDGGGNGNEAFWENSSISLLNALILALIDIANRNNKWEIVTLRNAVEMLNGMGAQKVFVDQNNNILAEPTQYAEQKSKLSVYFENLHKIPGDFRNQAFQAFQQSNFAGNETAGNVYSSAIAGLSLYLQDDIARLTSKNSIDLTQAGFPRVLHLKLGDKSLSNIYLHATAHIKIFSKEKLIEKGKVMFDETGFLDFPIKNKCPDTFRVEVAFNDRLNDSQIRKDSLVFIGKKIYKTSKLGHIILDEYTEKPIIDKADLTLDQKQSYLSQSNTKIEVSMSYSEQPLALFMVTPPTNTSYNILVSFLVDQAFNLNAEMASLTQGRKTYIRIHNLLDEFANLPAINAMDTKVSIGLGYNILFDFVVQNFEQITAKYGKEVANTIQANCATLIYILTTSNETAKTISEMIGKRTINVATNNSGTWQNPDNGSTHNQLIGQNLFSVDELQKLRDEEMIVFRQTIRRNIHGRRIEPKPIYDTGSMIMPYRYMFLSKAFDGNQTLEDLPIETPHLKLQLKDIMLNEETIMFDQQEMLHATDGPDDGAYNQSDVNSADETQATAETSTETEPIFNNEMLRSTSFMEGFEQLFFNLLAQSVTNVETKREIEQDIEEQGFTAFMRNQSYNDYEWLQQILGKKLAKEYKKHVKSVSKNEILMHQNQ